MFEKEFCKYQKSKYAIGVGSGTDAIFLSLKALGIGKGDEVITPTYSFYATAGAIATSGAKPVFVDIDLKNWNINSETIEKKITKKTKLILLVHTYGFPSNMNKIMYLKKKYKLFLIEDAAEMHGQFFFNKPCGSFGDLSTFSFYANKQLTTGEGGMISTSNLKFYNKMKSLRNLILYQLLDVSYDLIQPSSNIFQR